MRSSHLRASCATQLRFSTSRVIPRRHPANASLRHNPLRENRVSHSSSLPKRRLSAWTHARAGGLSQPESAGLSSLIPSSSSSPSSSLCLVSAISPRRRVRRAACPVSPSASLPFLSSVLSCRRFSSNAFSAYRGSPVLHLRGVLAARQFLPRDEVDAEQQDALREKDTLEAKGAPSVAGKGDATERPPACPESPAWRRGRGVAEGTRPHQPGLVRPLEECTKATRRAVGNGGRSSQSCASLASRASDAARPAGSFFSGRDDGGLYTEGEIGAGAFVSERPWSLKGILRYRSEDFVVREVGEDGKVCALELGRNDTSGLAAIDARREHLLRALQAHRLKTVSSRLPSSSPLASSSSSAALCRDSDLGQHERGHSRLSGSEALSREAIEKEVAAVSSVRFILTKHNRETPEAIEVLARATGIDAKRFSFAGMKDRRAITSQWIACSNPLPAPSSLPPDASVKASHSPSPPPQSCSAATAAEESPQSFTAAPASASAKEPRGAPGGESASRGAEATVGGLSRRRDCAPGSLVLPAFLARSTETALPSAPAAGDTRPRTLNASLAAGESCPQARSSAQSAGSADVTAWAGTSHSARPGGVPVESSAASPSRPAPASPEAAASQGDSRRGSQAPPSRPEAPALRREGEHASEVVFTAALAKEAMQHPSWDGCVSWSHFEPGEVHLGCLGGNRFSILLRDFSMEPRSDGAPSLPFSRSSSVADASSDDLESYRRQLRAATKEAANAIQETGFINYFGPQRFGTGARPTHHIGRALLHRQFARVCNLIMQIPAALPSSRREKSPQHLETAAHAGGPCPEPLPPSAAPLPPSASSSASASSSFPVPSSSSAAPVAPALSPSSPRSQGGGAFAAAQEAFWAGEFRRALSLLPRQCRQERQIVRVLAASWLPEWRRRCDAAPAESAAEAAAGSATPDTLEEDLECVEAVEMAAASGAVSESLARRTAATALTRARVPAKRAKSLAPPLSVSAGDGAGAGSPFADGAGEREMHGAGLARRDDVLKAVRSVSRLQRLIYVKAYAAYLWNLCASERARLYGVSRPVLGDLVLERPQRPAKNGAAPSAGFSREDGGRIRILQSEEECREFSINDVVLPLIGVGMLFPQNQVGDFLRNLMRDERISERLYRREEELFLDASYRHFVAVPRDFACELVEPQTSSLAATSPSSGAPSYSASPSASADSPRQERFSSPFALRLEFTLPPGVFASSLIREFTSSPFEHPFKQRQREHRALPEAPGASAAS
ncbi:hypothetical protein BESB_015240 [Besnoitia besnoiti]|uniref:TRUD domain-containing protein n=1 Tax=Besnoitia besnoiti TaxID=94643 RepID=A0A2A9M9C0_BESBE|nr:hypothetical protein BESB_015240 [Besnoitia besnoiti]PFH32911.1 hypothetical protein BESB_015240 [Besnoitia besnoiti]